MIIQNVLMIQDIMVIWFSLDRYLLWFCKIKLIKLAIKGLQSAPTLPMQVDHSDAQPAYSLAYLCEKLLLVIGRRGLKKWQKVKTPVSIFCRKHWEGQKLHSFSKWHRHFQNSIGFFKMTNKTWTIRTSIYCEQISQL